ncbi:hypothetical protein BGW38_009223, partial [Lunasporangiospora selenospora]
MTRLLVQKHLGSFQRFSAKTLILLSHGMFLICWILLGLLKLSQCRQNLIKSLAAGFPDKSVDQSSGMFPLYVLMLLIHFLIPCAFSMNGVCHEVVVKKMNQEYETARASEQQLESAEATSSKPPHHQEASQRVDHNKHLVSSRWNVALSALCLVAALLSVYFQFDMSSHLFVISTSRELQHIE